MSTLHVIFDPTDKLVVPRCDLPDEIKVALLSLPEGVEGQDIYAIARRLAELLLEQVQ